MSIYAILAVIFAAITVCGVFSLALASMDPAPSQRNWIFPWALTIGPLGMIATLIAAFVAWIV